MPHTLKKESPITIVGLNKTDNGRKCDDHPDGCSSHFQEQHLVTFEADTIERGYGPGTVLAGLTKYMFCQLGLRGYDCIKVYHGNCCVGFVGEKDRTQLKAHSMGHGWWFRS
ncbi:hypothetical protein DFS34DRAFT_590378 [Phlyctochytrium arcticum]|nr:hypothetical protein DFS34DRAFT_590378 [Phlyctochytrium arcticum]